MACFETFAVFVGQPDSFLEALNFACVDRAVDYRAIGFGDAIARVGEAVGEIAVVGEEEEALGLGIELADGIEAGGKHFSEQIDSAGLLALGDVGAVDAFGFVEDDVEAFAGDAVAQADALAVDFDVVGLRIDQYGELMDDAAIDGDSALEDHFFNIAAGSHAGIPEELLDSFFHRIIVTRSGAGWV